MSRTFADWLERRPTRTPADDLELDLRNDDERPADFESLAELREYLRSEGACDGALQAAPAVWRRFQRWAAR